MITYSKEEIDWKMLAPEIIDTGVHWRAPVEVGRAKRDIQMAMRTLKKKSNREMFEFGT